MPSFPQVDLPPKGNSHQYEPVALDEQRADDLNIRNSEESDIPLMKEGLVHKRKSRAEQIFLNLKRTLRNPVVIANLLILQLGVGSLFLSWRHQHRFNGPLKEISLHSPFLDRVEIPLVSRKSYAQYGMGGPEIWRSEPSDEVDRAWERVTAEYIFPVKESDVIAMNKDPSLVVHMPDEYRVDGEKTYLAKAAAFHNVHCLDYIRKAVYKDYYYPNGTDDNPFHAYHTAHCIMVLFEHLTCSGDPGVYLYRWLDEFNRPIADTNIWRKCWDFESVLEKHEDKAVQDMTETDIRKPAGAKSIPAADGVMKIINDYKASHPDYNPGQ